MRRYTVKGVSVVGLGYVGLPLAMRFIDAGLRVVGVDASEAKVKQLQEGRSYVSGVSDDEIAGALATGRLTVTSDYAPIAATGSVVICVPTPLSEDDQPDLRFILSAAHAIALHLQRRQLVILESSTFPGTTEDYLIPVLETSGLCAGKDFYVAYSPERINPGTTYPLHAVPKVVGGITPASTRRAVKLYQHIFDTVHCVSSTATAELTKLLENTQRLVNISLMNELAMMCRKFNVNLWEVVEAASTKPYGFTPYYPGPGIGGHCIPIDPLYLQWSLSQFGEHSRLIEAATAINRQMPAHIVERFLTLAGVERPNVLILGIAYKKDVNDVRESPALELMERLLERGASVQYHDPLVPEVRLGDGWLHSVALTPNVLKRADGVLILTDHTHIDYQKIYTHAKFIFDTRNVYAGQPSTRIYTL